eukprot:2438595-Prymnesium_polylepis.1
MCDSGGRTGRVARGQPRIQHRSGRRHGPCGVVVVRRPDDRGVLLVSTGAVEGRTAQSAAPCAAVTAGRVKLSS